MQDGLLFMAWIYDYMLERLFSACKIIFYNNYNIFISI